MASLTLPRAIVNALLHQAQLAPETEICGLIGARDGVAMTCYPVANAAATPDRRYAMDPKQQIDAMRRMRVAGEELLAIYHSHPHSPAAPSPIDIGEAEYPQAVYLIISLATTGTLQLAAFRINAGQATAIDLELI